MSAEHVLVLRGADVLAPEPLGRKDVVIAGGRILQIADCGIDTGALAQHTIDLAGRMLVPGFVDNHVHVLGGGGGLGFASRAPELQTSQLTRNGITTVVGMLGFDATTKDMRALTAKTKALREDGGSAYALTGATLEHPVPTLTGRIRDDIAFVEEIIGVGEISVSELGYAYDSNGPGAQYILEAASEALLAGRLARKRGILCLQVPPYRGDCLKPLMRALERTGFPIGQFIPSHVNQTDAYLADALEWARRGGVVDIGANYSPENHFERATRAADAVMRLIEAGVRRSAILVSSDGNGAPPKEEKREGQPARANYMPLRSLYEVVRELITGHGLDPSTALACITRNPADALGLPAKGRISRGADADLVVLDQGFRIDTVIARGRIMAEAGQPVVRGMFDDIIIDQIG